jgi:hypothetical protein
LHAYLQQQTYSIPSRFEKHQISLGEVLERLLLQACLHIVLVIRVWFPSVRLWHSLLLLLFCFRSLSLAFLEALVVLD